MTYRTLPFVSGPTCGLPAAGMKIGVRRTSTRVLRRPPGTAISDAALARLLADLPRVTAREQARLVTAAGLGSLPPGLPTAEQQARLDSVAQALVDDPQVTAAAEAYRLTPDETHFKVLGSFLGKYLDPTLGLVDRPEIALAEESAQGTFNPTTEETLTGPWTTIEDDDLDGPDAEVGPSKEYLILGNAIDIGTFARAGFQSSAQITTYAILDIVVPPGMQEVEVHPIPTRRGEQMVQNGCIMGYGSSAVDRSLWLTARNADGTFHVFEDPVVDGFYFAEDFLCVGPLSVCTPISIPFPLPAVPPLTTSDELPPLHIHALPAAGARYLLVIEAHASADTVLDGQASADQLLAINKVTVRFRSR